MLVRNLVGANEPILSLLAAELLVYRVEGCEPNANNPVATTGCSAGATLTIHGKFDCAERLTTFVGSVACSDVHLVESSPRFGCLTCTAPSLPPETRADVAVCCNSLCSPARTLVTFAPAAL